MIGLVYAGGNSKRFGQDKATYQVLGLPASNVQLAVTKLKLFCSQVLVCANSHNESQIKQLVGNDALVKVICDVHPFDHHGPLSAIFAATAQFSNSQDYLSVAVDYPYIKRTTLDCLAHAPQSYIATSKHNHYSLAHFRISNYQVKQWLKNDNWRLRTFITDRCDCQPLIYESTDEFSNLNYQGVNQQYEK
ncbi:NTP transferase domain-containing protein [Lactobacillus sp. Marseille-P7033]|nr:NTP transferase domain-containing protein [Lactobacillus sp. Marseille-P7033]NGC77110.1 NTP transferase domain-containing protein [Limosilactobacillus reuteri]